MFSCNEQLEHKNEHNSFAYEPYDEDDSVSLLRAAEELASLNNETRI